MGNLPSNRDTALDALRDAATARSLAFGQLELLVRRAQRGDPPHEMETLDARAQLAAADLALQRAAIAYTAEHAVGHPYLSADWIRRMKVEPAPSELESAPTDAEMHAYWEAFAGYVEKASRQCSPKGQPAIVRDGCVWCGRPLSEPSEAYACQHSHARSK